MILNVPFRRRGRPVAVGVAFLLVVACSSGCDSLSKVKTPKKATVPSSITIGFSPLNQSSELLRSLSQQLEAYAATKGAKVITADPHNDAATQARQLNSWIDHGQVQAIWAIARDATVLKSVLDKANGKGIAVLATGTPQDYGQTDLAVRRSYSFIDYQGYGHDVGKALGQCANDRLGGKARVLYLQNPAGTVGVKDFDAGLKDGLKATSPGSQIVTTVDNRIDKQSSQEATVSALRSGAGINAIASANDDGLSGAVDGLTKSGTKPESTCVVGAGGSDDSLTSVRDSKLYAVVALQFEQDLKQNVDQMLQMIAQPQAVGLQLLTPIKTIME